MGALKLKGRSGCGQDKINIINLYEKENNTTLYVHQKEQGIQESHAKSQIDKLPFISSPRESCSESLF